MQLLTDILRRRAADEPDRIAYRFLDDTGAENITLTYRELHDRALAVAGTLHDRCAPGDRALLVFGQSAEFVIAYFGCLYARIIAVPVNPPRRDRVQEATRAVVGDCTPTAVLTVGPLLPLLRPVLEPLCTAEHWLAVDELHTAETGFTSKSPDPDSVAFLQYTSGSTSAPKGVMVTHRNLVANEEMIRRSFGHDRESTVVGWAPFFHDQGLIGNVLQPVYVGATSVLMSPLAFIRRPLLWLEAISRYRVHTSGGPNFAFDACVARATAGGLPDLDLSSWQVAFNGAEPIRADTLARFTKTFAPLGFRAEAVYPCYGLAEATLLVSASVKGRGPRLLDADVDALAERRYVAAAVDRGRTLVGVGELLPGEDLRIVDPDSRELSAPDRIGEIWVAGDHVAQGYWERPEATAATFHARRADDPERVYLRTGDLGLLVDGELYVVGRIKDMIIIRGRNYYPHDIEHTVQRAHPALRPGSGAAFSVPGRDGEKLVVVQEVRRDHTGTDSADITGAIRAAVLREHELAIGDVVLTAPDEVHRTSSGKIMRAAARNRYLDAGFAPWVPRSTDQPTEPAPKEPTDMQTWQATNPDYAAAVQGAVLSMPAAKHLGFTFGWIAPGEAEIVQPYRTELTQHNGFFQGGVLGSLADFAGGSAAGTLLPPGWVNMTIDYTVKILAPAKGPTVVARGRVVKPGALITIAAVDVFSVDGDDETLSATALVTMRNVALGKQE
ncbi:AMP-binding protein [Nocardia sp. NPDC058176]|uniref:AMP-binding protein n=1 Tax=Nocardia sp. NPDC058176 TaxID=3346368 RepID=UPI0036DC2C9C